MALETGTYISSLNSANPVGATDPKSQGDDHLRLIKSTLLNTFPGITGAVTATHTELNLLDGVTASTAELNTLDGITATVAELNILDGVTSTTAELNKLDGVGTLFHSGNEGTIDHDALLNFVANEHIDHSAVSITAGDGLTGGGTIAATRDLAIGTPGATSLTSTNAVTANSHTHALTTSGIVRTDPGTGGAITVSTSAASGAATNGDMWLQV